LLDHNSWRLLAEFVVSNDCQCWLKLAASVNRYRSRRLRHQSPLQRENRDVLGETRQADRDLSASVEQRPPTATELKEQYNE
jgi:hypothetical protein